MAVGADVALLMVYGAVGFFFTWRFVRFRKAPSLMFAITAPLGWLLVALWDLGIMPPLENGPLRWIGVIAGMVLLGSAVRWDVVKPEKGLRVHQVDDRT